MKKSEAINIIYELLEDLKELDIGNIYLAEEIVNKLEDIGMRPPSHMKPIPFENGIQYPLIPGDLKNDNGIWCTPGYFGWEPEDEKD